MGNKRVSQLVALTPSEVSHGDLLLIIDTSAKESKKITISDISAYLNVSASITAYSAIFADTASFILGTGVFGAVLSASFADRAMSASMADKASIANTASYALTASFVAGTVASTTASFLRLLPGAENGTASYAKTASFVNASKTSSFLLYTPGINNGTASYALTASFFSGSIISVIADTASYALRSKTSGVADLSLQSFFLLYSGGNNGTASYAMQADSMTSFLRDYGIYLANTQSWVKAQLDSVAITPSLTTPQITTIEAWGSVDVSYTSSMITSGSLQLIALDLVSGEKYYFDSTPIVVDISPGVSQWDNYTSGTITMPFSLAGQSTLSSSTYQIFVMGSPSMSLNSHRTTRFNVNSYSDVVSFSTSAPIQFSVIPSSSVILRFTMATDPSTVYTDYLPGMLSSGSTNIYSIDINNQGVTSINYAWALTTMSRFDCSTNIALTSLPGMPSSLTFLSCSNCGIQTISSLSNIPSMSYFDCYGNSLISLPSLPITLSYLQCSNNNLTSIPTLPYGVKTLFANNNQITSLPSVWPVDVISMSLNSNTRLTSFSPTMPVSLSYFSCNNSPVESFPTLPISMSFMYASNCNLSSTSISDITLQLSNSAMISGVLDITLNGTPPPSALSRIGDLQSLLGWVVSYDP